MQIAQVISTVLRKTIYGGLRKVILGYITNRFLSAVFLFKLILLGILVLAFEVELAEAGGTVYIRADGSVDPPTAPISSFDNVTYTFTGNINTSLVIERDNIVVDGASYTLLGEGSGIGVDLTNRSNVTIKNLEISGFKYGIYLDFSSNNTLLSSSIQSCKDYAIWFADFTESSSNSIVGNKITNNGGGIRICPSSSHNNISNNCITASEWHGIILYASKHNILSGNNITANKYFGIGLTGASSNNTLRNNSMTKNRYNFHVDAWKLEFFLNDVDVSNTVDGKPVYYWINRRNAAVPLDAGYVALINCSNTTVKNLNLTSNGEGLLLIETENCTITSNNIANNSDGIHLCYSSNNNNISCNNMKNNDDSIWLDSYSNSICYNNITGGSIWLLSSNNTVSHNTMTQSGISLSSSNNTVSHNNISGNGIWLDGGSKNTICYNNVTSGGIGLHSSTNNVVSHNNIANNDDRGVYLSYSSSRNEISNNNITNCYAGFVLTYSSNNNTISCNNIANTLYGVQLLFGCSKNAFYHNNFSNVTLSVDAFLSGTNIWDAGYPYGGNYWSNYEGADFYRGSHQNETGSDGLGDTPYPLHPDNTDYYPLMKPYAGPHDIGVKVSVSKNVVAEGYNTTVTVNVTIINYGEQAETFNFTFQTNTTTQEQTLTLASRNSATLTFTWNTTGLAKGNYTISAVAEPVLGETYTADNTYAGWIVVTILGDVDGDGEVDMEDIGMCCLAYGSRPGHPRWNPNADINNDNKICMKDIGIACMHYGETDP